MQTGEQSVWVFAVQSGEQAIAEGFFSLTSSAVARLEGKDEQICHCILRARCNNSVDKLNQSLVGEIADQRKEEIDEMAIDSVSVGEACGCCDQFSRTILAHP